jgi:hypothetical protein
VLHPARIFDGGACFEPPCSARRPVAGACSRVSGACSDERGEVTEEEVNTLSCMFYSSRVKRKGPQKRAKQKSFWN